MADFPAYKTITKPFAVSGIRYDIPIVKPANGRASYEDGFPGETMIPIAAGGIPPAGQDVNGVLHDITSNLAYLQRGGGHYPFNPAIAGDGGYPFGAVLRANDAKNPYLYQSLQADNVENFNTTEGTIGVSWNPILGVYQYSDKFNYVLVGTIAVSGATAYIALEPNGPDTEKGSIAPGYDDSVWQILGFGGGGGAGGNANVKAFIKTSDGAAKTYTVEHNLNTRDIIFQAYDLLTGQRMNFGDVVIDENTLSLTSGVVYPTNYQFQVVVIGAMGGSEGRIFPEGQAANNILGTSPENERAWLNGAQVEALLPSGAPESVYLTNKSSQKEWVLMPDFIARLPRGSDSSPGMVMGDGVTFTIDPVTGVGTAIGGGGNAATANHAALYGRNLPEAHGAHAIHDYDRGEDQATINTGFAANFVLLRRPVTLEYPGLMPADMFDFLNGKGAVVGSLTLYIRADGNDANDGLTAATALASLSKAVELVNTRYKGFINNLIFDVGPGTFDEDWSPADIEIGPKRFTIHGAGIDATIFYCATPWDWKWDNPGRYSQERTLDAFTFKRKFTAQSTADASIASSAHGSLSVTNVRLDHSEMSSVSPYAYSLSASNSYNYFGGYLAFRGAFLNLFQTNTTQALYFTASSRIVCDTGTTINRVFYLTPSVKVIIESTAGPIYNNAAVAGNFAILYCGSDVIFTSAAMRTAWLNGWTYSADASSKFRTRGEA